MTQPTTITARVSRVVDGDTIRVFLSNSDKDESLRILALDTEESNAGGSKPVTPWGKEAKLRAEAFFSPDDEVELVFPGSEEYEVCLKKYRGNYGRLLVFVMKNGMDFQEIMIRRPRRSYSKHNLALQSLTGSAARRERAVYFGSANFTIG